MAFLILALLEEHQNAAQVKACLEAFGHKVLIVSSFLQAAELFLRSKIDLIISDVHLENGGSVFDFLRQVKKNELTSSIPFILFSSQPTAMAKYLADGLRTTARVLGAARYIEMATFDPAYFLAQINDVLPIIVQITKTDKIQS